MYLLAKIPIRQGPDRRLPGPYLERNSPRNMRDLQRFWRGSHFGAYRHSTARGASDDLVYPTARPPTLPSRPGLRTQHFRSHDARERSQSHNLLSIHAPTRGRTGMKWFDEHDHEVSPTGPLAVRPGHDFHRPPRRHRPACAGRRCSSHQREPGMVDQPGSHMRRPIQRHIQVHWVVDGISDRRPQHGVRD